MIRIYAVIALAVSLLVGGLWLCGHEGHQKALQAANEAKVIATQRDEAKAALEAVNRAAIRNQEITISRIAVAEKQRATAQRKLNDLQTALDGHPEWAGAPVPDSVWQSLPGGSAPEAAPATGTPGGLPGTPAPK
jgi:hypothetical protein